MEWLERDGVPAPVQTQRRPNKNLYVVGEGVGFAFGAWILSWSTIWTLIDVHVSAPFAAYFAVIFGMAGWGMLITNAPRPFSKRVGIAISFIAAAITFAGLCPELRPLFNVYFMRRIRWNAFLELLFSMYSAALLGMTMFWSCFLFTKMFSRACFPDRYGDIDDLTFPLIANMLGDESSSMPTGKQVFLLSSWAGLVSTVGGAVCAESFL